MIACRECAKKRPSHRSMMYCNSTYVPKNAEARSAGAVRIRWYLCKTCGHRQKTVELSADPPADLKRTTERQAVQRATQAAQLTVRDAIIRSAATDLRKTLSSLEGILG